MTETATLHRDQIEYWNGPGGARWVAQQRSVDRMVGPVVDLLIAQAQIARGSTVFDIGCGCGATTVALADIVGPEGRVTALDVSAPILDVARQRLADRGNVQCVLGDAQTYRFPAGAADLLLSRFGVMFFGDPTAAFSNMKRALKPGGRIVFACWRPIAQNPWMQLPLHAAYKHVPRLPKPGPEDPGPFSFADPERVTRILTGAGLASPRFTPADFAIDLAMGGGLDAAVDQACKIGATSRALQDQPADAIAGARAAIRDALTAHVKREGVILGAAIWLVETAA